MLNTDTFQPSYTLNSVDAAAHALYNLAPFPGGQGRRKGLSGSLHDLSVPQLLSLIRVGLQTGGLVIEGPDGRGELAFVGGRLASGQLSVGEVPLAERMRRVGLLSAEQVRSLAARAEVAGEKQAALTLINAGYLSQGEILDFVRAQTVEIYYRLAGWLEGDFRFESGAVPPADRLMAAMDTAELIAEGARRRRETEQLYQKVPDLGVELRLPEWHADALGRYHLNAEEEKVVAAVAPGRTLEQIAVINSLSGLQVRTLAVRLLQAGVVELGSLQRRAARPGTGEAAASPKGGREGTRALVGRLFQRKRSKQSAALQNDS